MVIIIQTVKGEEKMPNRTMVVYASDAQIIGETLIAYLQEQGFKIDPMPDRGKEDDFLKSALGDTVVILIFSPLNMYDERFRKIGGPSTNGRTKVIPILTREEALTLPKFVTETGYELSEDFEDPANQSMLKSIKVALKNALFLP